MTDPLIPDTLSHLRVPVADLVPYGQNPRRGNVDAIAESLRVNGQYRPIVVRTGTNEVLAGNHTLRAATSLGWDELAVTYVDVDDVAARRIVLVDNKANDLATYEDEVLLAALDAAYDAEGGLAGTGFDIDELEALRDAVDDVDLPDDADGGVFDEPSGPAISDPGDAWSLGAHTLIVGDGSPADLRLADALCRLFQERTGEKPLRQADGERIDMLGGRS